MIKVNYICRLGNQMFEYALGRILAEEMGYELSADPLPFPATHKKVRGKSFSEPTINYTLHQRLDLKTIIDDKQDRLIILNGWFQQASYYLPYMDRIKKWFYFPLKKRTFLDVILMRKSTYPSISKDDCLMYVRLGDFVKLGYALTEEFYLKTLEMAKPRKLYIATENPNDPFFAYFKKYNPIFLKGTPEEDISAGKLFNKIIMSPSTFAWWGAMLSDAQEIYYPLSDFGPWSEVYIKDKDRGHTNVDLRIDDPRFIYFYNCPTINTKRLSKKLLDAKEKLSIINEFHQKSKAFWFE